MKVLPESKSSRLSMKDTILLAQEIYGENIASEFDNNCIEKVEILFLDGKASKVNVIYEKIKITHADKNFGYWPIQQCKEESSILTVRKLLEET